MTARKPKVRRFEVWANCGHYDRDRTILEFDNKATDEEIEAECADACDTLVGNNFDTGWRELEPNELTIEEEHNGERGRKP